MNLNIKENFNFGYACINTELRKKGIFMSRTCRLNTLKEKGIDYVKELALENLKDLLKILYWNKENGVSFLRLSSDIFPFASHKDYMYSLDFADEILKKIGKFVKTNNMRLTMHPGQYTLLSSPNENITNNSIEDLKHHCDVLDRIGVDQNGVIIIHGGGSYSNKIKTIKRIKENILKLPENVKNRLVLENCEMSYNIDDLLPISKELLVPIVIDFHHNEIFQSSKPIEEYYEEIFNIWKIRNIKPKVHISNSVPGVHPTDNKTLRRKHSDLIHYIHDSLLKIDIPIDIMVEAKLKEQALISISNLI